MGSPAGRITASLFHALAGPHPAWSRGWGMKGGEEGERPSKEPRFEVGGAQAKLRSEDLDLGWAAPARFPGLVGLIRFNSWSNLRIWPTVESATHTQPASDPDQATPSLSCVRTWAKFK